MSNRECRTVPVDMKNKSSAEAVHFFIGYKWRQQGSWRVPTYIIEHMLELEESGKLGDMLKRELKNRREKGK